MTDISSEPRRVDLEFSTSAAPLVSLRRLEREAAILLVLSLLMVTALAIAFLMLALPANDDFIRATMVVHIPERTPLNYWHHFTYLYTHWQGRWAAFGLESAILPRANMTRTYPALIGGVAVVDLIGLFVVCRLFTRLASRWFSLGCSLCLAAVFWAMMPSLSQTIYWFVGGIENLMSLSLAAMLLAGLIHMRASVSWMILAALLAIITTGLHEMYGAMLCIALAAGAAGAYWMKSENRTAWLVALIAATIGLGIVAGAPGNRVRMVRDSSHHVRHLPTIMKLAGKQLWSSGREWLFDPKLLAVSLFIAFSPTIEAARPVWSGTRRVPWRMLIPVTWIAMLCTGFFMPSYAFIEPMPGRTLSGNFIVFAMGWLLIVFVWTRKLDTRDPVPATASGLRSNGAASIALLLLAVSLLLGGNTLEGAHDLVSRKVFHWRASVEKRYASLAAPGEADRILLRLSPSSRLLYSGEVWVDPLDWVNTSLADFFHVHSVRVLPEEGKETKTAPVGEGA